MRSGDDILLAVAIEIAHGRPVAVVLRLQDDPSGAIEDFTTVIETYRTAIPLFPDNETLNYHVVRDIQEALEEDPNIRGADEVLRLTNQEDAFRYEVANFLDVNTMLKDPVAGNVPEQDRVTWTFWNEPWWVWAIIIIIIIISGGASLFLMVANYWR